MTGLWLPCKPANYDAVMKGPLLRHSSFGNAVPVEDLNEPLPSWVHTLWHEDSAQQSSSFVQQERELRGGLDEAREAESEQMQSMLKKQHRGKSRSLPKARRRQKRPH